MFGLFGAACKGLHCAGCGKGIPASVLLLLVGIFIANLQTALLVELVIISVSILSGAGIIIAAMLGLFMRKGPAVAFVRREPRTISFSQHKFLETGDPEWLALMGPIEIPEPRPTIQAEVIRYGDPD